MNDNKEVYEVFQECGDVLETLPNALVLEDSNGKPISELYRIGYMQGMRDALGWVMGEYDRPDVMQYADSDQ